LISLLLFCWMARCRSVTAITPPLAQPGSWPGLLLTLLTAPLPFWAWRCGGSACADKLTLRPSTQPPGQELRCSDLRLIE